VGVRAAEESNSQGGLKKRNFTGKNCGLSSTTSMTAHKILLKTSASQRMILIFFLQYPNFALITKLNLFRWGEATDEPQPNHFHNQAREDARPTDLSF
jgi:hypothetical protein